MIDNRGFGSYTMDGREPLTILLNLPDDIVRRLTANGEDPARTALEALAVEGYRSRTISEEQIRRMLGLETRMEVHGFLKCHRVYLNYTAEDLEHDIEISERLSSH
jgi:predicted HTH domain antitoxin